MPYIRKLEALQEEEVIDRKEFLNLLLEFSRWREKFSRWEIMGQKRVDPQSGQSITMDDFQNHRLAAINGQAAAPPSEYFEADIFASQEFDNRFLMDDVEGIRGLQIYRQTNQHFRRLLSPAQRFAKGLSKGRWKASAKGAGSSNAKTRVSAQGQLRSAAVRQGLVPRVVGAGNAAIIYYDIGARLSEYGKIDEDVAATGTYRPLPRNFRFDGANGEQ